MSKVSKSNNKKAKILTTREKLWKQVNKKITKVKYTFNPTLYEHSSFYEVLEPKPKPITLKESIEEDQETKLWTTITSEIDWSDIQMC